MFVNRKNSRWPVIVGLFAVFAIISAYAYSDDKPNQPVHPETVSAAEMETPATETETVEAEPSTEAIAEPATEEEYIIEEEETDYLYDILLDTEMPVPAVSDEAGIGDTIEVEKGLFMTVNDIRANSGGFWKPDGVYLIIDCTYENRSKDEKHISTLLNLTVKDADGYRYDPAILAETKGSLNVTLASGDKVRGEVAFDVPDGTTVEYFYYDPFLVFNQSRSRWKIAVNVRAY